MPLKIPCPNPDCDVVVIVLVGKPGRCPECGTPFEEVKDAENN